MPAFPVRPESFLPLCDSCRFNVWKRYILAGKPTQSMGCCKHIVGYPDDQQCRDYEREPGTDD